MKKLVLICMLCLLCGCQVDSNEIRDRLSSNLNAWANNAPISYTTMDKPLYSYYLPKDVGRISSNEISSLLTKDGVRFIMNFNPSGIVIHDYYHSDDNYFFQHVSVERNANLYYKGEGTFLGSDQRYHRYSCKIMELDEDDFLLYMDMEYVNYVAVLKEVQINPLVHSMFTITKSIQYDSKEVVELYSLKATSESIKQDLDEFNEELPNNGSLEDLINQANK